MRWKQIDVRTCVSFNRNCTLPVSLGAINEHGHRLHTIPAVAKLKSANAEKTKSTNFIIWIDQDLSEIKTIIKLYEIDNGVVDRITVVVTGDMSFLWMDLVVALSLTSAILFPLPLPSHSPRSAFIINFEVHNYRIILMENINGI